VFTAHRVLDEHAANQSNIVLRPPTLSIGQHCMTVVDCLKEFPDRFHSGVIALVGAF
jgi:hypothetical protein